MKKKKANSPKTTNHPMQGEILEIMASARNKAAEAKLKAQSIGEELQHIIDEADVTMPLINNLNPTYYESMKGIWTSVSEQVESLDEDLKVLNLNINSTTGSSSTSTVVISGAYINNGYLGVEDLDFANSWLNFEEFASRSDRKDKVTQLIKDFGFDVPQVRGDKSPLELFEIAHSSFQNPIIEDNPVQTSLLPLRECIDAIVASLIRMRTHQEPAQGQRSKIISIGNQLRHDRFPQVVIDELADEWHSLYNELSGLKKKDLTRADWLAMLNRGTSFLYSLLNGLDQGKLRR